MTPPHARRIPRHIRGAWLAFAFLLPAGCGSDGEYLASILQNTIQSYGTARPIDDVIADSRVTPAQATKLRLIQRMRDYANAHGFNVRDAYSTYVDNSSAVTGYAVIACAPDQFTLYTFPVPLFGPADTKVFYDRDMAEAEAAARRAEGYDVFLGVVEGFSTLGFLGDPVRSSNLKQDEGGIAELIFHELLHNTVFKPNDPDFNESMATFVGRTAGERFFEEELGASDPITVTAKGRFADQRLVYSLVESLYSQLSNLYAEPIDREAKLVAREPLYAAARTTYANVIRPQLTQPDLFKRIEKLETNNATIYANVRYQAGFDRYRRLYDFVNHDFPAMFDVLREAALQEDSLGYLDGWLADHSAP